MVRIHEETKLQRARENRKSKGGRKPLPPEVLLSRRLDMRFPPGLMESIEQWAGLAGISPQQYILRVLDGHAPNVVPSINRDLWIRLSPSSSNLNQLAYHLNQLDMAGLPAKAVDFQSLPESMVELRTLLLEVRGLLIGQMPQRRRTPCAPK